MAGVLVGLKLKSVPALQALGFCCVTELVTECLNQQIPICSDEFAHFHPAWQGPQHFAVATLVPGTPVLLSGLSAILPQYLEFF